MLLKINLQKLKASNQKFELLLDFCMLWLIGFNLLWLLFDTLFASLWVQRGMAWLSPGVTDWYRLQVHPYFFSYELIIIGIYWVEFFIRWGMNAWRRVHHRFWFFPFVHWYDVLGALPIASFRFLRLLRFVAVVYRLQTSGIVDFSTTWIGRFFVKYKAIVAEEMADQVVVNVLQNVRHEVVQGHPVLHRLVQEVLLPRQVQLGDWLSHRLTDWVEQAYFSRRTQVADYVGYLVRQAVLGNLEMQQVKRMPLFGGLMQQQLEAAIAGISYQVLDQLLRDLHSDRCREYIQESLHIWGQHFTDTHSDAHRLLEQMLVEALDVVIAETKVKKWQSP